jgi:uncharacterized membrane protein
MASLTLWKFDDPDDAHLALKRVRAASKQGLVDLQDAAIVTWPEGKKRPQTKQLHGTTGAGAVGGAFWGMLFGLIFFVPVLGAAVGAAAGAVAGRLTDLGIDDDFIASARERLVPGTSALFLLVDNVVIDKVKDVFDGMNVELVQTNMSSEQEQELRDVFQPELVE